MEYRKTKRATQAPPWRDPYCQGKLRSVSRLATENMNQRLAIVILSEYQSLKFYLFYLFIYFIYFIYFILKKIEKSKISGIH